MIERKRQSTWWIAGLLGSVLTASACRGQEIPHPTPDNRVTDDRIAHKIDLTSGTATAVGELARRLAEAKQIQTIELQGTGAQAAKADSAWVTGNSELVVADLKRQAVEVFGLDGQRRAMIAIPSDKQGARLKRVIGTPTGHMIVIRRSGQVGKWERSETGFRLLRATMVSDSAHDACTLDDEIFVRAPTSSSLFTRWSASAPTGGFGRSYRTEDAGMQRTLSDGLVACIDETKTLVAMSAAFPEIQGMGPDGAEKWVSRIEDFKRPRLIEVRHGREEATLNHSQTEPADRAIVLMPFMERYVIVQTWRFNPTSESVSNVINSYILDSQTGEGQYVGASLPWVLSTVGSTLVARSMTDSSKVVVYAVGR